MISHDSQVASENSFWISQFFLPSYLFLFVCFLPYTENKSRVSWEISNLTIIHTVLLVNSWETSDIIICLHVETEKYIITIKKKAMINSSWNGRKWTGSNKIKSTTALFLVPLMRKFGTVIFVFLYILLFPVNSKHKM